MITDADVAKITRSLAGTFVTEKGLHETFVTKKEFRAAFAESMRESRETFATKTELYAVRDELKEDISGIKVELGDMNDKIDTVITSFGTMQNLMDGIAKRLDHSIVEHAAGAVHLARHDRHIAALAKHTGTKLPA